MAFTPFRTFNGDPDYDAVLEQTTLIGALGWNRRDAAQQVLDLVGGGTVRAWQFGPDSFPPSWALLQQGNRLCVLIFGTTNFPAWYSNVVGTFAVQYGTFAAYVHNFFYTAWQGLKIALLANMPAGFETMPISFAGHSLGSAIAFLGSVEWAQRFQAPTVEFMGLAKPKAFTDGYNGPLPNSRYFISTGFDAVPMLPPNSLVISVLGELGRYENSIPMDWRHYSPGYRYNADNVLQLQTDNAWQEAPGASDLAMTPFYHPIPNYMQAAESAWLAILRTGRDLPLVALSRAIRSQPAAQNTNVNIDFRQYVDIAQQNQVIFRSQGPGPLTPGNLNSVNDASGVVLRRSLAEDILPQVTGENSEMQKMSFFYHVNAAGYSESHLVPDQTGDANYLALAAEYTRRRLALSGVQTTVDWIRFSTIGTARQVRVYTPFDLPAGTPSTGTYTVGGGHAPDQSDFGGTAILLRKVAASGLFSHWFFRGVPDEVVVRGGEYDLASGWTNILGRLQDFMTQNNFRWATVQKEGGNGHPITGLANNGAGNIVFAFTDNPFNGLAEGTKLRIRITGQPTRPLLNGSWSVVVKDANTCISTAVEYLPQAPVPTGRIFKVTTSNILIAKLSVERITERRVGRPFGLYRGRSKAHAED